MDLGHAHRGLAQFLPAHVGQVHAHQIAEAGEDEAPRPLVAVLLLAPDVGWNQTNEIVVVGRFPDSGILGIWHNAKKRGVDDGFLCSGQ